MDIVDAISNPYELEIKIVEYTLLVLVVYHCIKLIYDTFLKNILIKVINLLAWGWHQYKSRLTINNKKIKQPQPQRKKRNHKIAPQLNHRNQMNIRKYKSHEHLP